MKVVYNRCAGIDVHKKSVVVRILTPDRQETRTFGTMTRRLHELAQWLTSYKISHVAMESTGCYWKPVWNILERETECELLLVNAKHMKQVPGRKTDVKDAEWIAELLQHGLLTASYVPSQAHRELKEMTRFRRTTIQTRSQLIQRLQKVLEGCNVKLESVISDVTGVSGMAMIRAMADGEADPEKLASLAHRSLKATPEELCEALEGLLGEHQRLILKSIIRQIDMLDSEIDSLDRVVAERMEALVPGKPHEGGPEPTGGNPVEMPTPTSEGQGPTDSRRQKRRGSKPDIPMGPVTDAVRRLDEVPGIAIRSAQDLLAETGVDMSPFPTARHFVSWAKLCPGNNESGGKRRSGRTGKGNKWLRSTMVDIAWAAVHKKGSYFGELYRRLSGRRGKKRAILAVARSILEAVYYMLKRGESYRELGATYLDERRKERIVRESMRRLTRLGYTVTIEHPQESPLAA